MNIKDLFLEPFRTPDSCLLCYCEENQCECILDTRVKNKLPADVYREINTWFLCAARLNLPREIDLRVAEYIGSHRPTVYKEPFREKLWTVITTETHPYDIGIIRLCLQLAASILGFYLTQIIFKLIHYATST